MEVSGRCGAFLDVEFCRAGHDVDPTLLSDRRQGFPSHKKFFIERNILFINSVNLTWLGRIMAIFCRLFIVDSEYEDSSTEFMDVCNTLVQEDYTFDPI
jgi:hypothetical protein